MIRSLKFTLFLLLATAAHAAPIPPDIAEALRQARTWNSDQSRKPLIAVEQFAQRSSGDPEQGRMLAAGIASLLADPKTTAAARGFLCQKLALVGTAAEAPLLAQWLGDPERAENARYALQGMQSPEADAALREALGRLSGKYLAGVVLSLGERRDAASTGALIKLLDSSAKEVASAAAWALGRIGSAEAAAALAESAAPGALEALLNCDVKSLQESLQDRLAQPQPPRVRVALVTGLARVGDAALDLLLPLMKDPDPFVSATAIREAARLPGAGATAALAAQLSQIETAGQSVLIESLAERGDKSAAAALLPFLSSNTPLVKAAAAQALGSLGDAGHVPVLAGMLPDQGAESALARLSGPGTDGAILKAASSGTPAVRSVMINVLVARGTASAAPALLAMVHDANPAVAATAARAAAKLGNAEIYPKLAGLLFGTADPAVRAALEDATASAARHAGDPKQQVALLEAGAKGSEAPENTVSLLRVLARIGSTEALPAVRNRLEAAEVEVRDAAVRALVDWQDASAADDLFRIVEKSPDAKHRALALRALLRLAAAEKSASWVDRIKPLARTPEEKKQLLGTLAGTGDPVALEVAVGMMAEAEVSAEAGFAALNLGKQLLSQQPDAVEAAMEKVASSSAPAVTAQAKALQAQAREARLVRDRRGKERALALSKELPASCRIAVYVDCGPETASGSPEGPRLKVAKGTPWKWVDEPAGTVAFSGGEVVIEATQVQPKVPWILGFTWWDHDGNGRAQSVWINGKKLVDKTPLPVWQGKNQGPATVLLSVPPEAAATGKLHIAFRAEAASNAVVSELWLAENPAGTALAPTTVAAPALSAPAAQPKEPELPVQKTPIIRANAGAAKKILIVTGCELHNWRQTTPVLTEALAKDPRLEISVVEEAAFLGAAELKNYDVIVLHYQNWQVPDPGAEALANLVSCVEGGRGLVLVHFACGAFIDWPTKTVRKEFLPIAGRVWNPQLRGHDPRGPFRVDIVKPDHPIVKGLSAFETEDELYTCLDGDVPIELLATARSKVDQKDYPMAFVLTPGKGRTFHCALGHDVKALSLNVVGELFRRGTAWAAGL